MLACVTSDRQHLQVRRLRKHKNQLLLYSKIIGTDQDQFVRLKQTNWKPFDENQSVFEPDYFSYTQSPLIERGAIFRAPNGTFYQNDPDRDEFEQIQPTVNQLNPIKSDESILRLLSDGDAFYETAIPVKWQGEYITKTRNGLVGLFHEDQSTHLVKTSGHTINYSSVDELLRACIECENKLLTWSDTTIYRIDDLKTLAQLIVIVNSSAVVCYAEQIKNVLQFWTVEQFHAPLTHFKLNHYVVVNGKPKLVSDQVIPLTSLNSIDHDLVQASAVRDDDLIAVSVGLVRKYDTKKISCTVILKWQTTSRSTFIHDTDEMETETTEDESEMHTTNKIPQWEQKRANTVDTLRDSVALVKKQYGHLIKPTYGWDENESIVTDKLAPYVPEQTSDMLTMLSFYKYNPTSLLTPDNRCHPFSLAGLDFQHNPVQVVVPVLRQGKITSRGKIDSQLTQQMACISTQNHLLFVQPSIGGYSPTRIDGTTGNTLAGELIASQTTIRVIEGPCNKDVHLFGLLSNDLEVFEVTQNSKRHINTIKLESVLHATQFHIADNRTLFAFDKITHSLHTIDYSSNKFIFTATKLLPQLQQITQLTHSHSGKQWAGLNNTDQIWTATVDGKFAFLQLSADSKLYLNDNKKVISVAVQDALVVALYDNGLLVAWDTNQRTDVPLWYAYCPSNGKWLSACVGVWSITLVFSDMIFICDTLTGENVWTRNVQHQLTAAWINDTMRSPVKHMQPDDLNSPLTEQMIWMLDNTGELYVTEASTMEGWTYHAYRFGSPRPEIELSFGKPVDDIPTKSSKTVAGFFDEADVIDIPSSFTEAAKEFIDNVQAGAATTVQETATETATAVQHQVVQYMTRQVIWYENFFLLWTTDAIPELAKYRTLAQTYVPDLSKYGLQSIRPPVEYFEYRSLDLFKEAGKFCELISKQTNFPAPTPEFCHQVMNQTISSNFEASGQTIWEEFNKNMIATYAQPCSMLNEFWTGQALAPTTISSVVNENFIRRFFMSSDMKAVAGNLTRPLAWGLNCLMWLRTFRNYRKSLDPARTIADKTLSFATYLLLYGGTYLLYPMLPVLATNDIGWYVQLVITLGLNVAAIDVRLVASAIDLFIGFKTASERQIDEDREFKGSINARMTALLDVLNPMAKSLEALTDVATKQFEAQNEAINRQAVSETVQLENRHELNENIKSTARYLEQIVVQGNKSLKLQTDLNKIVKKNQTLVMVDSAVTNSNIAQIQAIQQATAVPIRTETLAVIKPRPMPIVDNNTEVVSAIRNELRRAFEANDTLSTTPAHQQLLFLIGKQERLWATFEQEVINTNKELDATVAALISLQSNNYKESKYILDLFLQELDEQKLQVPATIDRLDKQNASIDVQIVIKSQRLDELDHLSQLMTWYVRDLPPNVVRKTVIDFDEWIRRHAIVLQLPTVPIPPITAGTDHSAVLYHIIDEYRENIVMFKEETQTMIEKMRAQKIINNERIIAENGAFATLLIAEQEHKNAFAESSRALMENVTSLQQDVLTARRKEITTIQERLQQAIKALEKGYEFGSQNILRLVTTLQNYFAVLQNLTEIKYQPLFSSIAEHTKSIGGEVASLKRPMLFEEIAPQRVRIEVVNPPITIDFVLRAWRSVNMPNLYHVLQAFSKQNDSTGLKRLIQHYEDLERESYFELPETTDLERTSNEAWMDSVLVLVDEVKRFAQQSTSRELQPKAQILLNMATVISKAVTSGDNNIIYQDLTTAIFLDEFPIVSEEPVASPAITTPIVRTKAIRLFQYIADTRMLGTLLDGYVQLPLNDVRFVLNPNFKALTNLSRADKGFIKWAGQHALNKSISYRDIAGLIGRVTTDVSLSSENSIMNRETQTFKLTQGLVDAKILRYFHVKPTVRRDFFAPGPLFEFPTELATKQVSIKALTRTVPTGISPGAKWFVAQLLAIPQPIVSIATWWQYAIPTGALPDVLLSHDQIYQSILELCSATPPLLRIIFDSPPPSRNVAQRITDAWRLQFNFNRQFLVWKENAPYKLTHAQSDIYERVLAQPNSRLQLIRITEAEKRPAYELIINGSLYLATTLNTNEERRLDNSRALMM
jgi:hypothetical protein